MRAGQELITSRVRRGHFFNRLLRGMDQIFNFDEFVGCVPGERFQAPHVFIESPIQNMGKQFFLAPEMIVNKGARSHPLRVKSAALSYRRTLARQTA